VHDRLRGGPRVRCFLHCERQLGIARRMRAGAETRQGRNR
jgi:hypothetical protein